MRLSKFYSEKFFLAFCLILAFGLFVLLTFYSEATFDAGDGIRHYLISKYSWNHPHLFLDSWGKPFFTLISSPFSQFGFTGITLFNILCGIASAYLVFKISKKLNYGNSLLAIPFLFFAPIYFPTMNSGLTEPFFGFVLIFSIYLMTEHRYDFAAIFVSFLPFVRSEGFLLLPLFFVVLIYSRSFRPALLLSFGTLLYSFIGLLVWGDFFWIKNQNPYNGTSSESYGSGELLSFVYSYDYIWGPTLGILFIIGILTIIYRTFFPKELETKKLSSFINIETVLIVGSFVVYFAAHSIMWWKGLANSMGLVRVFAGVMPCAALICLKGFNILLTPTWFRNQYVKILVTVLVLFFILKKPFVSEYFPFRLTKEQLVIKDVSVWMKAENHDKKKLYYLYPYLPLLLDIDAFDENKATELWGIYRHIKQGGIKSIPDGTIVIWDAHFGPNECGIPLEKLMSDPNFDLLKSFYPRERFTTLGGFPFSVSVFQKRSRPKIVEDSRKNELASFSFNLSNGNDQLNKEVEYGKTLEKKTSEFPLHTNKLIFQTDFISGANEAKNAIVVLTVDKKEGGNVYWEGQPLTFSNDSSGIKKGEAVFNFSPDAFYTSDVVKVFVWNKEKKEFLLQGNRLFCLKN